MHDVNKSGWFLLIPIYNFILAVTEGESAPNQYGADPKLCEDRAPSMSDAVSPTLSTLGSSQIEQIEKLADLKAKGILTEEEFTAKKSRFLTVKNT